MDKFTTTNVFYCQYTDKTCNRMYTLVDIYPVLPSLRNTINMLALSVGWTTRYKMWNVKLVWWNQFFPFFIHHLPSSIFKVKGNGRDPRSIGNNHKINAHTSKKYPRYIQLSLQYRDDGASLFPLLCHTISNNCNCPMKCEFGQNQSDVTSTTSVYTMKFCSP